MDGAHPTGAGGDLAVTGMVTIMAIAMAITAAIVPVIVQDIMQVSEPHTIGLHLIPADPGPPIMPIKIVLRGLEKPGTNNMMQGRATGSQQLTVPDPLLNLPTGPIMFIRIAMEMYTGKMVMIGTG